MAEHSSKEGILGYIYGDHWIKRKNIIIASFFIPLLFSYFTFLISSYFYNMQMNLKLYFQNVITYFGNNLLIIVSVFMFSFILLVSLYFDRFLSNMYKNILNDTSIDIYEKKKGNPRSILLKNFCLLGWEMTSKSTTLAIITILVYIPIFFIGIFVGYLLYTHIHLYSIETIINIISVAPYLGTFVKDIVVFITKEGVKEIFSFMSNIANNIKIIIYLIMAFLLIPLMDLIDSRVYKRQRSNIKKIITNGLRLILVHLNLLSKISTLCYYTILCLFTDKNTTSIDIPVVNDRNIDDAFGNILGINCYVTRWNLIPKKEEILEELNNLPKDITEELKNKFINISKSPSKFKKEVGKEVYDKLQEKRLLQRDFNVFGIGEKGTLVYAMVKVPPPTRRSRIIRELWCSDPIIQERIISQINVLEGA